MDKKQKDRIAAELRKWAAEHALTQAEFARKFGINTTYVNNIWNGNYAYNSGKQIKDLADKYFIAIAEAIDLPLKETFWDLVPTDQFTTGIYHLETAHQNATTPGGRGSFKIIIGESGCGKTTFIDRYCRKHPANTFRVTINDYDTVHDIVDEIARELQIGDMPVRRGARLRAIGKELKRRAAEGQDNLLVIDEGENTRLPGLKAYKAIYDMIIGHCAFVIAGTPDLIKLIGKLMAKEAPGIQQFARRAKANIVYLPAIDREFPDFMGKVEDLQLRKLLKGLCNNIGELHDYLEPALFSADRDGVPLTAEYFKAMYGIQVREE